MGAQQGFGYTGINTCNPSYQLDVAGKIHSDQDILTDGEVIANGNIVTYADISANNLHGTNTGDQTVKSMLGANLLGTTLAAGSTFYTGPYASGLGANASESGFVLPYACTIGNLRVRIISGTPTVKVLDNGALTSLLCATSGGACTDTSNSFSAAAGDLIAFRINTGVSAVKVAGISIECDAQ